MGETSGFWVSNIAERGESGKSQSEKLLAWFTMVVNSAYNVSQNVKRGLGFVEGESLRDIISCKL